MPRNIITFITVSAITSCMNLKFFLVRFHISVVVVVGVRHFSLFELQYWNHYLEFETTVLWANRMKEQSEKKGFFCVIVDKLLSFEYFDDDWIGNQIIIKIKTKSEIHFCEENLVFWVGRWVSNSWVNFFSPSFFYGVLISFSFCVCCIFFSNGCDVWSVNRLRNR